MTVPGVSVRRLPPGHPALTAAWRKLQSAGRAPCVFLTWQWCAALLEDPVTSAGTTVCVVERSGEVIGLFPVERTTIDGLRTVGPAGWRWLAPDHLDVVSSPEDRMAVANAIAGDLLRGGDDMVDLDGLAHDGALTRALETCSKRRVRTRVVHKRVDRQPTPYVDLRQTPVLRSASLRSQVGRGRRSLEREGGSFEVATEPQDVVRLLDELMRWHVERFGRTSAVFATADRQRGHRVAAGHLAQAGLARIYRLRSSAEDIALLYALRHGSTLSYYSSGMRPDAPGSPGRTLLGLVALDASEEGLDELDLLRGEHEYKARFASGTRHDVRLRLFRATPAVGVAAVRRLPGILGRLEPRRVGV